MSSKNGAVLSTEIVPEVLINKENYEDWSFRLQTYLMAQGLWNNIIVDEPAGADINYEEWERKNATALHAIHISCGPHAFSAIKRIRHAKQAWDNLAISMTEPEPEPELEPEPEPEPEPEISQPIQVHQNEPLYSAVRKGDWYATNWIIRANPDVVRARITYLKRTALHVAAMAGHLSIVKLLVQNMSQQDLELTDQYGFTALVLAITCNAKLSIAECMVGKNIGLLEKKVFQLMLPAVMAFRCGHKELGRYLYSITPQEYYLQQKQDGATIICTALYMQSFDVALDLLSKCKDLAVTPDIHGRTPVYALANLPSAFESGCRLKFWQRCLYQCICVDSTCAIKDIVTELKNLPMYTNYESMINSGKDLPQKVWSKLRGPTLYLLKILGIKDVYDMKLVHTQASQLVHYMSDIIKDLNLDEVVDQVNDALFLAVDRGNVEFITSIVKANPELVEALDNSCKNLFMRAIQFRQPKIFSLIYNLNTKLSATSALDGQRNNMLHVAAKLGPNPGIPGAALQMQRELQWFQEVKSIVPPWALDHRNSKVETPGEIFTEAHKELVSEGEKWMKETATSCTVVGALIVTIMFAAAFTVPGGNNGDSGFPIFLTNKLFMIFIISDSLSLFSSTTSVLMFLGILTSRYAEEDFLQSLPRKLMFGLFTLFFSIVSMMVAFCATLLIVLSDKYSWIFIPVICLASIPVTLFVFMQFPLLVDIFLSTYGGGIFDKKARI